MLLDPLKPPSVLSGRRHPYVVFLAGLMMLSGIGGLLGPTSGSGSVESTLNPFFSYLWSISLVISGAGVVAGAFWRDAWTGLLLEKHAQRYIAGNCFIFVLSASFSVGWDAFYTVCIVTAFGLASAYRARQITLFLKDLKWRG